MKKINVFEKLDACQDKEIFLKLLSGNEFELKRIVSLGQATPQGEWYDQEQNEWVVLLKGSARLEFEGKEGDDRFMELGPGDYVNLPAKCRHRVDWTDKTTQTVWLAIYYK